MADTIKFNATCTARREKALLVELRRGQWRAEAWVPLSLVHDDSEVYVCGGEGTLVVPRWWAEQNGLADVERRALPTTSLTHRNAMSALIGIVEDMARGLRPDADAICECGACDEDPIQWHQREVLDELAGKLRHAMQTRDPNG